MRTTARLISVAFLSLGLLAGCATTTDEDSADTSVGPSAAEQAIADAKAANAQVAPTGFEWRDTNKLIKQAEEALAAGDEAKAESLAKTALAQAQDAQAQARAEDAKFQNSLSDADRAALAGSAAAASRGSMAGKVSSYEVEGGDHLWGISGKDQVYGDSYQWPLIYKANRSQIKDADLIYPGQVLDIDQDATASEISRAIRHAKTRGAWSVGNVEQSDRDYLNE